MPPPHHDVSRRAEEVDGRTYHPLLTSKRVHALGEHWSSTSYELQGWDTEKNESESQ